MIFYWRKLLRVGLVGVPGAEPPGRREFSKIFKRFLKKIAKKALFSIFF